MEVERNLKVVEGEGNAADFAIFNDEEVRKANRHGLQAALEGFGQESLVTSFLNHDINLRNLSLLTEEDLEILGVESEDVRKQMLTDFAIHLNQVPGYEKLLEEIDRDSHNTTTMKNMIAHLHTLHTSIEASHWKLYVENPSDIPIGDHAFASTYVIKTLNQITKTANELDAELRKMQEEYDRKNVPKKKSAKHLRTLGGVVGIFLGGYLIYKLSTKANLAKLSEYLQPFLENQPGDSMEFAKL